MPRFRVLAGPSFHKLTEIEANSNKGFTISTDAFEGQVAVYLKGYADPNGIVGNSAYFMQEGRQDVTWSIQFQGRFLQPHSADDILLGNVFDHSLVLPWGFSAATSFMQYIDPTLEQDLSAPKPWALSPLITTIPYFNHTRLDQLHKVSPFPSLEPIEDNISELRYSVNDPEIEGGVNRKTYFQDPVYRRSVTFGPRDLITGDFCYDYMQFSPDGISLRIPGGFTFDMMKYWDGQPVRFVCCERVAKGKTVDGMPWGRIFWCIAIEAVA